MHLSGADFEFVDAVKLQSDKPDAKPVELTHKLPVGADAGPQETMLVEVNPGTLPVGRYKLSLSEPGGKTVEIPLRILPSVPTLTGLPLRVNLGETSQTVTLKGSGLQRIEALSTGSAQIELAPGTDDSERKATVRLGTGLHAHQELDLQMKVDGMSSLQSVKLGLKVAPARPKITAASMSRAASLGIEIKPDELPADAFVTYSVRVEHLDGPATLKVACLDSTQTLAAQELRPGEKSPAARLERSGSGGLFLSLMPGAVGQPGCELSATVETSDAGASEGWKLGRIARLPKIEKFTVTDEKLSDAVYAGVLEGEHLESIGKVGWDAETRTARRQPSRASGRRLAAPDAEGPRFLAIAVAPCSALCVVARRGQGEIDREPQLSAVHGPSGNARQGDGNLRFAFGFLCGAGFSRHRSGSRQECRDGTLKCAPQRVQR